MRLCTDVCADGWLFYVQVMDLCAEERKDKKVFKRNKLLIWLSDLFFCCILKSRGPGVAETAAGRDTGSHCDLDVTAFQPPLLVTQQVIFHFSVH